MIFSDDVFDFEEAGRTLGHDIHTQSRLPEQAHWPAAVREGFSAAAHAGLRRRHGDRFIGKWLLLRLNALQRGRAVAADVTPQLLREIDLRHCPVTRQPLTHGTLRDTDASIDRLNNDAAYAASNLAVMSVRANRAKAALDFGQVHAQARLATATDGLSPAEWLRLAVLMLGPAHATRPHEAPLLPLCAPLPRHAVRLAAQQIQRLFTEEARRPAGKNRLVREFSRACTHEMAQRRLVELADAAHHGLKQAGLGDDRWDVWLQAGVLSALQRWKDTLDGAGWARAAAISGHLSDARRETPERLCAWQLPTRGYGWLQHPLPRIGGGSLRL